MHSRRLVGELRVPPDDADTVPAVVLVVLFIVTHHALCDFGHPSNHRRHHVLIVRRSESHREVLNLAANQLGLIRLPTVDLLRGVVVVLLQGLLAQIAVCRLVRQVQLLLLVLNYV